MGGVEVRIHEPLNVLSTMLLALGGRPKNAKVHPIAEAALEHTAPFREHASLAWLKEFYRAEDLRMLYGHALRLSGPVSFAPRSGSIPDYIAGYEPVRMLELPARMAAFYDDAKLGTFRRAHNAEYTQAAAEVKDALDSARIESFLEDLYGTAKYALVVVPVPTHPTTGGAVDGASGWESCALLFPPRVGPRSSDPVSWSWDPQATHVLAQHELSHALLADAMRERGPLLAAMRPILMGIPPDSPFARRFKEPEMRFAELFIRGSTVSYLRRTTGDEEAGRWMADQVRRHGTPLVRDFFLAIEDYLGGKRRKDFDAFLKNLPAALRT